MVSIGVYPDAVMLLVLVFEILCSEVNVSFSRNWHEMQTARCTLRGYESP
jgi:hypothetical protein